MVEERDIGAASRVPPSAAWGEVTWTAPPPAAGAAEAAPVEPEPNAALPAGAGRCRTFRTHQRRGLIIALFARFFGRIIGTAVREGQRGYQSAVAK